MALDTEVNFLLELEFRLQSDLDRVHERLELLIPKVGEHAVHLTLIQGGRDG